MYEYEIDDSPNLPKSLTEEEQEYKERSEQKALPPSGRWAAQERGRKVDRRHRIGVKQWLDSGKWVRVKSSNVSHIMYDMAQRQLCVIFQGKSMYKYISVPVRVAEGMFTANSMGKYIWSSVRDRYNFEGPFPVSV